MQRYEKLEKIGEGKNLLLFWQYISVSTRI